MHLPRFTVAQRLWLGLLLLLGLFAIANVVSLDAARDVDQTLNELVLPGDERRTAGYAMRTDLSALVGRVQAYVRDGQASQRTSIQQAQLALGDSLSRYGELAKSQADQQLAQDVRAEYQGLTLAVQELLQRHAESAAKRASLAALRREAQTILAKRKAHAGGRDSSSVAHSLGADIEREVREMHALLGADQPPGSAGDLAARRDRFGKSTAQRRSSTLTATESAWLASVQRWHARSTNALFAYQQSVVAQDRASIRMEARVASLDAVLTDAVQPAARADLVASVARASKIAHEANAVITRSLLIAFVLGTAVAWATVRAVRAPLRKVVASSRGLAAGDFSRRVDWKSRDELGELADAFNNMADQLQSTTVSRAYLEGVVNSMTEALFVVCPQGIVQTANPAARGLLGYEEAELVGAALHRLSSTPELLLTSLQSAQILDQPAMIRHKDGTEIPVLLSAMRLTMQSDQIPALVCIAQDLRARIAAELHQRQTAVVFENTRDALILTDGKLGLSLVNPAFHRITGYDENEAHGCHALQLFGDSADSTVRSMHHALTVGGFWQGELELRRNDSRVRPVWVNVSAVRDRHGKVINYVFVVTDISEMKEVERKLDELAHYDALTALPNRRLLLDRGRRALVRAQRSQLSVALLYLDLDDFKDVNDTFGHAEGDRLLQEMTQRLGSCVRTADTLARLGGDEFVVLLENVQTQLDASQVAEKLLVAISMPYWLKGIELRPRASIGIAIGPSHGTTVEELLKSADAAMYRAKHGGGAGFEFFTPELTKLALEKLQLQNALRHPDLRSQLVVHYQPQLDLQSGRVVSAEALVRWDHPTEGLLLPGRFIRAAEEAGLISLIGEWVLRVACQEAVAWQSVSENPFRVAVNVSPHQIKNARIVDAVMVALNESGLEPSLLELEVTEDALQVGDEAQRVLNRLKELGVSLALDDFGSGYSSLGSLKALPFDRLKIDRAFMRDVASDSNGRSLVRAIIAMAHNLHLGVLAEGVENEEQLAFLQESRCDEAQGYLIGHPLTSRELQTQIASVSATCGAHARRLMMKRMEKKLASVAEYA